jgi:replicative DNA helicase
MQNLKEQLAQLIANPVKEEKDIIFQLQKLIYENDISKSNAKGSTHISDLLLESTKFMESDGGSQLLVKSGFQNLDKVIGGFAPGELVVVGGRPGMGKTQLLVNMVLAMSKQHAVQYFSFDLSEFLLTTRFISAATEISCDRILQHKLSEAEKTQINTVQNDLKNHQIYLNDGFNNSLSAFKAHCEKQVSEKNIRVIIVDYLHMMSSFKYRNNRELEISAISRELKNIARDNNITVIAASQLSRAVETRGGDRRPCLSDLRESGAIEQDADKVIFVYRADYYGLIEDENGMPTNGQMELIIAKNRNGALDTAHLSRNQNFSTITDGDDNNSDFNFSETRLDEIGEVPF